MKTLGNVIQKEEQPQAAPTEEKQRWLDDHGEDYGEFTSHFVTPRQVVWHLDGDTKGSEQFGQHVAARVNASPTHDGESPGEEV
jgi:hypothetical protein